MPQREIPDAFWEQSDIPPRKVGLTVFERAVRATADEKNITPAEVKRILLLFFHTFFRIMLYEGTPGRIPLVGVFIGDTSGWRPWRVNNIDTSKKWGRSKIRFSPATVVRQMLRDGTPGNIQAWKQYTRAAFIEKTKLVMYQRSGLDATERYARAIEGVNREEAKEQKTRLQLRKVAKRGK